MRLDSTYPDVKIMQQVPLCLRISDFEMNLKSSLLFQSDTFVIVPHLLLAPVHTVVKSTNLFVVPVFFLRRSNAFNRILCRNNNDL